MKAVWESFSLASNRLCFVMVNPQLFCFTCLFSAACVVCFCIDSMYCIVFSNVSFCVLRV